MSHKEASIICRNFVNEYLTHDGSEELNLNGSSTPVELIYIAPEPYIILGRLVIYIASQNPMNEEGFGDRAALENGVLIEANGIELDNWKTSIDIITSVYETKQTNVTGIAGRNFQGCWDFHQAIGEASGLFLPGGKTFKISIRDDLSGLEHFRLRLQGKRQR